MLKQLIKLLFKPSKKEFSEIELKYCSKCKKCGEITPPLNSDFSFKCKKCGNEWKE
jgi:tRNA(Ile2) C34 agmatinyltransferase TiaS